MYHDEFARKPAQRKPIPFGENLLPRLPLQVGGGLSLGLMASLDQTVSMLLFYLGGLLPLVACSLSISLDRASQWFAPRSRAARPLAVPIPGLLAGHHLRIPRRVRSIR